MTEQVAAVGLGTATLGNLFRAMPDDVATDILHAALAAGITHLDTSPFYGQGLAERRLGEFLHGNDDPRLVISTKVGRLLRPNPDFDGDTDPDFAVPNRMRMIVDYREAAVRLSLHDSLDRMRRTHVHHLYVHDPEQHGEQAMVGYLRDAVPAVCRLRDEGAIQKAGVGTGSVAAARCAIDLGDLDVVMIAGRWSLLDRSAGDLLDECQRRDIAVIIAAPYHSGILATDPPQADSRSNYAPASADDLSRALAIAEICHAHEVDLPTAALHFARRHPAVQRLMLGASSVAQLHQNLDRLNSEVPADLWTALAERTHP